MLSCQHRTLESIVWVNIDIQHCTMWSCYRLTNYSKKRIFSVTPIFGALIPALFKWNYPRASYIIEEWMGTY